MIDHSVAVARASSDGVVVVVSASDVDAEARRFDLVVAGGATRSDSVRAGLAAVPPDADIICVHDAARPCASTALFGSVIAAVRAGAEGAIPGLAVTDTIKVVGADGAVQHTPERSSLVAVQTPQAFRASALRAAHAGRPEGTDDAALVEAAGGRVVVVAGEPDNRKVTHPDDLDWARVKVGAR
jgi:2-C-methyl-D-erythritol 4-phosphate cytidylyltransferase